MKHLVRIGLLAFMIMLAVPQSQRAGAQDTSERRVLYDTSGLHVYASYHKVPWARVDSLIQLEKNFIAHTQVGREMGCWVDREFLIHFHGGLYNVLYKTYRTKFNWPSENPGCGMRAWREVVPDADERAAIQAGWNWVVDGTDHYDEIYWEPYPKH